MTRTLLEKCEISVSPEERTFLQLAASMTGLSLSAFIRKAAISAAKDAIDKNNHYLLSGNDVGELFSVIDNGFIPNKRLEEAIRLARDIEKMVPPMVIENLGSPVQNGQDISCGYEFSENLLKNIAIQVKSPNFRKGKNWKAVMGGLPILISIDDEVFLRGVLSGAEKLNKDDVLIADVKLIQTIEQNKIVNKYRVVNVIEHKKSSQICTF